MANKSDKMTTTSLENLYADMCKKEGKTPKTVEQLKAEDAKKEQEQQKKIAQKKEAARQKAAKKRKEESKYVRVIKKEKGGVTMKARGVEIKMTWAEFEKNFKPVEGKDYIYTFTDEFLKNAAEVDELVNFAVITYRRIQVMESRDEDKTNASEYLTNMATLGGLIGKIGENVGGTIGEVTAMVKERYNMVFGAKGIFAQG